MRKVGWIKLHPAEMFSEIAFVMAHCIGADSENEQEIADSFTLEEKEDCIALIRKRLSE